MSEKFNCRIKNDLGELAKISKAANEFLEPLNLDPKIVYGVDLILEEMLTNVITHGYEDEGTHEIDVSIGLDEDEVSIVLEDDGAPFNPLSLPWASHSADADELMEEGLGIHFVRNMMNAMQYRREDEKNILEVCIDL
ncbi:serine/threonine-protein kinase RsbW [Desulfatibacillum alkenivorans DSM 16219]|uniref:Serine/threonine-protein kinase RsbW n=1 Tax=Desulfatibacillum alkenivorans DSM 16219 TaxID=1121393 RepID=A0A1M6GFC5_9BACT|nr:ATP-binding protein [Desulfatibacillum alkenivorans]SHJ08553.1 serine/threonine-protein kinase RsbW [Desulfatibacillum alkenivorans DSM 16219]